MTAEFCRPKHTHEAQIPRKQWGPYLSQHQWGTVREADSRDDANAWTDFSTNQVRWQNDLWGGDDLGRPTDNESLLLVDTTDEGVL